MYGMMAAELPGYVQQEIAERQRHAARFHLGQMLRKERRSVRR